MDEVKQAAERFGIISRDSAPFGDGLIHRTWRVTGEGGIFLVQRLNGNVFTDPEGVAENAAAAADRIRVCGGESLDFLREAHGRPWYRDPKGFVWRASVFIPDSRPAAPAEAREAARLLGKFPGFVAGATLPDPTRILPGFHDTPARYRAFDVAAATDSRNRHQACRSEAERLRAFESLASALDDTGLPTRLVHNDAKLDNVLVDTATGRGLCVIDLDTVMPGVAAHDFGDLVRSSVTGRPEDESDLGTITIRHDLFRELASGYLEGAADWITPEERDSLVEGALVITYEQALRFLTDYLEGDVYYPVEDSGHNLRRARAQMCLLDLLVDSKTDLETVIREVSSSTRG